ncbi:MAG: VOC family protein [Acidimicrobiales bacterium]
MTDNGAQIGLVLDCADPEALAEFWAPALGYVSLGTAGAYVALFPNGRPGPKLLLQRVPEAKAVKNRMHFDIEVADIHAEADRLVALGATQVSEAPQARDGPASTSPPRPAAPWSAPISRSTGSNEPHAARPLNA